MTKVDVLVARFLTMDGVLAVKHAIVHFVNVPELEPQPQLAPDAKPTRRNSHGENDDWRTWTLGHYSRMEVMWRVRAAVPIDEQDDSSFQTRQGNYALTHPRKALEEQVPERIALRRDAKTALYTVARAPGGLPGELPDAQFQFNSL
ncbi:hypothetical protein T492DRAFT_902973, partial [Pavlovales sp. CCMP2436]